MKSHYVYIMSNSHNTVLYTGVTSDLRKRVYKHKKGLFVNSFTSKYSTNKLVYFEQTSDIESAILREKQIKAGSRKKKIELIQSINKRWDDLSLE